MKDNCQLLIRIMYWNVSDQKHKTFIKVTVHTVQKQINIKFIQKLKPVIEVCKEFMIYRGVYKYSNISPKDSQPQSPSRDLCSLLALESFFIGPMLPSLL